MKYNIALAGNPNSGKTTLFNALTGSNQFVGNWPGVTVEKKEGKLKGFPDVTITDLPGVYSLSPYTMEEVVARDYLINERPAAVLNIVDGTNLERNLYLTTQILELGIPVVIAINMMDIVAKSGNHIDTNELSRQLGCKVIEISALKGTGIAEAAHMAVSAVSDARPIPHHSFSGVVEHALAHIEEAILHNLPEERQRWYAIKIFEGDEKVISSLDISDKTLEHIQADIKAAETELDDDAPSIIAGERYVYIAEVLRSCYRKKQNSSNAVSDKIDKVVTNRWLGLPIFAAVMFVVYYLAMVTLGSSATDWVNDGLFGEGFSLFGVWIPGIPVLIAAGLDKIGAAGWLSSLIVNGIVAGVGAVIGFLPQLFILFLLLAFLEACGYMARIAFVLDRVFRKFGLSGKSFIPMIIGTGCSIPGIMASRTIENENDRRMTIITTSFIPCGAKVPFIAMISGALFNGSALIAVGAYFLGMISVIMSGIILKKTKIFAGDPAPFIMELPSYHMPSLGNLLRSAWDRGWSFIKKAGTVVLLSTIIIWFVSFFGFTEDGFRMLGEDELEMSLLASVGRGVSWLFIPLGFGTWQAAVASITGLVAKENIVGTMGVLYGSQGDLYDVLAMEFTRAAGLAFLTFNLLCAPCFAAVGAIRNEMNSPRWTWFAVIYQCSFAYAVSLIINQFGMLFMGESDPAGLIAAFLMLIFMVYMLFKPYGKIRKKEMCIS